MTTAWLRPDLPTVEVVAHCHNYARLHSYQLASLLWWPPERVNVTMTTFFCRDDARTVALVEWFAALPKPPTVSFKPWPLERGQLLRRAIGRNLAAKATTADAIVFADCDYAYGIGCLDAIPDAMAAAKSPLCYPRQILRTDHERGDLLISSAVVGQMPSRELVEKHCKQIERWNRAVGGFQLVPGDVARERGYLPDTKWQQPASRWRRTFEDRAFRAALGTKGKAIDVPNVFRLGHSRRGRFDRDVEL